MRYSKETVKALLGQPTIGNNDIAFKDKDVWGVSFKTSFQEIDIVTVCDWIESTSSFTKNGIQISILVEVVGFF